MNIVFSYFTMYIAMLWCLGVLIACHEGNIRFCIWSIKNEAIAFLCTVFFLYIQYILHATVYARMVLCTIYILISLAHVSWMKLIVCVFQEASVFSCAVLHHLPTFPYICVERDRVVVADSAFGWKQRTHTVAESKCAFCVSA